MEHDGCFFGKYLLDMNIVQALDTEALGTRRLQTGGQYRRQTATVPWGMKSARCCSHSQYSISFIVAM